MRALVKRVVTWCNNSTRCTCAVIAMEEELKFAIREGGRTVGAGRVTKILK